MYLIVFSDNNPLYHSIPRHYALTMKASDILKCWNFNTTCLLTMFINELLAPGVKVGLIRAIQLKTD